MRNGSFLRHRGAVRIRDVATMRENYNPLPALTINSAVSFYDSFRRGDFGGIQLVWDSLEEYDDILGTLVEKRESALLELDYSITLDSTLVESKPELKNLAEEQQAYLEGVLAKISNMEEALSFLSLAPFRHFSHLEIVEDFKETILEPIEQWFWARPNRRGEWYYNPSTIDGSADLWTVDRSRLIIRECPRPINVVAMFAIVKKAHAESGWDGFLDVFGNPAVFFEMPPGTDDKDAEKYDEVINQLVGDGRGTYGNGGKIVPVETAADKGENFRMRMESADKAMVLRATGGILTVLTESGSGTLAGNAQAETFAKLAAKEGVTIGGVLNSQYFERKLEQEFGPNVPKLARFTISPAPDNSQDVDNIVKLAGVGYRTDEEQVTELTGLRVTGSSFDPSVIYPTKSVGLRPTEAALEKSLNLPLEPLPPELLGQGDPGQSVITNREDENSPQKDPLPAPLKAALLPFTPEEVERLAAVITPVIEEAAVNGVKEAQAEKQAPNPQNP